MFKAEPSLQTGITEFGGIQTIKPSKAKSNRKLVILLGSAFIFLLFLIITPIVLSQRDVVKVPYAVVSQHSVHTLPPSEDSGCITKLSGTSLHPFVRLVKSHFIPSIAILVGFLVVIIGVAITLVVLAKAGEQQEKETDQNEVILNQPKVEESFWQQNMWPLIGCGLGLLIIIILALIAYFLNVPKLFTAYMESFRASKPSKAFRHPVPHEKSIKEWVNVQRTDMHDWVDKGKLMLEGNTAFLNVLANNKAPSSEDEKQPPTSLTVFLSSGDKVECSINAADLAGLYVGLYSCEELRNEELSFDYIIYNDPRMFPMKLEIGGKYVAMPFEDLLKDDKMNQSILGQYIVFLCDSIRKKPPKVVEIDSVGGPAAS